MNIVKGVSMDGVIAVLPNELALASQNQQVGLS